MATYAKGEAQGPIAERPPQQPNHLDGAFRFLFEHQYNSLAKPYYPVQKQYPYMENLQSYCMTRTLNLPQRFPNLNPPTQAPSLTTDPSTPSDSRYPASQQTPSSTRAAFQFISPRYQGNRFAAQNQCADIPEELNTSVWITNLPPTCTHADLLGSLPDVRSKIYATVINQPQDGHTTSAAKIVFFDVEGKNRLLACARTGIFSVDGLLPHVIPNRIRTAAQPLGPQCRVLIIRGPAALVNSTVLYDLFSTICVFELQYVKILKEESGRGDVTMLTMEWAFGSYRCQAERVHTAIQLKCGEAAGNPLNFWRLVSVFWGRDPCDRQSL
ncbi:hypothetical protein ANO14919_105400 [Xylariales sp. No.14919]|nr:hypothetical protein ANO14919_105400 [Xylariales sp. No.14919]